MWELAVPVSVNVLLQFPGRGSKGGPPHEMGDEADVGCNCSGHHPASSPVFMSTRVREENSSRGAHSNFRPEAVLRCSIAISKRRYRVIRPVGDQAIPEAGTQAKSCCSSDCLTSAGPLDSVESSAPNVSGGSHSAWSG